jgi:hypothetical protein
MRTISNVVLSSLLLSLTSIGCAAAPKAPFDTLKDSNATAYRLPGMPATPAAPVAANVPRFHDFRILSQTQVMDPELKEKLGKILGDEDSFDNANARCAPGTLYAEMGLSWSAGPGAANDILVSFSCSQVVSRSFAWPHPATGMKPNTVKELSEIVQKLWPQGA